MGPRNLGIFRKFAELNAFNILHLQAELVYLEQELKILTELDDTSGHATRALHAKSAYELRKSVETGHCHQWQKTLEVREKLKEYSMLGVLTNFKGNKAELELDAALLQQAELLRLKPVRRYDLGLLQQWLVRPEGGNGFLKDIEGDPWDDGNEEDLISLYAGQEFDTFTSWITSTFTPWLHRLAWHRWKVRTQFADKPGLLCANL